ncbi:fatty acid synthase-like isoform X3 [Vespa crabro]|uniref:fatty acid synthase-like isoform X3 n=1 Tax=Vespa crabro TaxID=7445 RepID=UPI001F01B433|nr:fatty acid synthase-like isoform X3 [Vespa crabro]
MERICEKRVEESLPVLAIQWGAIRDFGFITDTQNKQLNIIGGTLQRTITSCLRELNRFLLQVKPIVTCMLVANKQANSDDVNNVVDIVLNIMDIKDLKTVCHHTSLAGFRMDSMTAVEIRR